MGSASDAVQSLQPLFKKMNLLHLFGKQLFLLLPDLHFPNCKRWCQLWPNWIESGQSETNNSMNWFKLMDLYSLTLSAQQVARWNRKITIWIHWTIEIPIAAKKKLLSTIQLTIKIKSKMTHWICIRRTHHNERSTSIFQWVKSKNTMKLSLHWTNQIFYSADKPFRGHSENSRGSTSCVVIYMKWYQNGLWIDMFAFLRFHRVMKTLVFRILIRSFPIENKQLPNKIGNKTFENHKSWIKSRTVYQFQIQQNCYPSFESQQKALFLLGKRWIWSYNFGNGNRFDHENVDQYSEQCSRIAYEFDDEKKNRKLSSNMCKVQRYTANIHL